ncbi:hypothetical protein, partial [Escherichia coli]|uniref:hypothetical protein n=1 Tax=Escherichia coli TaxID=562 RepID=UPI003CE4CAB0
PMTAIRAQNRQSQIHDLQPPITVRHFKLIAPLSATPVFLTIADLAVCIVIAPDPDITGIILIRV